MKLQEFLAESCKGLLQRSDRPRRNLVCGQPQRLRKVENLFYQSADLLENGFVRIPQYARFLTQRAGSLPSRWAPIHPLPRRDRNARWHVVHRGLKTTTSRYPDGPDGVLSLDPQLISYSWASGISDVAIIAFVRKHAPEIQYLKASISEGQRQEFGQLVEATASQIEAGQFTSRSGIRYPQNSCLSCPHLGLCLNDKELIATHLIRRPGAMDLDWLDELLD